MDEWDTYFGHDGLSQGLTWQWLFSFHNEHRIVFTKLLAWLNLKLFGLDFIIQQEFNLLLFAGLLLMVARFKHLVERRDFQLFPAFLLFLLTPLNWQNHGWGFQSQFHLFLLFSVMALCYACDETASLRRATIFSLLLLMAAYSFSAGVVAALVYLCCQSIFTVGSMVTGHTARKAGVQSLVLSWCLVGSGLALWFLGYQKPENNLPLALPVNSTFWKYFLNILSLGFGITQEHPLLGVLCLLAVALPVTILLYRSETRWKASTWKVATLVVAMLAVLASVSMGRGYIGWPKESRYVELGFLLVPGAALAWWLAVKNMVRRTIILVVFWLICTALLCYDRSIDGYRQLQQQKLFSLRCIRAYYSGMGNDFCPVTFPEPIGPYLEQAKQLELKFTTLYERGR
jgi:hypothetical protein